MKKLIVMFIMIVTLSGCGSNERVTMTSTITPKEHNNVIEEEVLEEKILEEEKIEEAVMKGRYEKQKKEEKRKNVEFFIW